MADRSIYPYQRTSPSTACRVIPSLWRAELIIRLGGIPPQSSSYEREVLAQMVCNSVRYEVVCLETRQYVKDGGLRRPLGRC
ncbi:jg11387 [Pararge aegeria aegeria]|uniref:Jg11387 protein n=1 Tax=Pararge aegeria aegeria TaxID=348720 RepID=A0A8S4QMI3_9NEOP|nr:jg11387 [Pararge aegeria aegeria]